MICAALTEEVYLLHAHVSMVLAKHLPFPQMLIHVFKHARGVVWAVNELWGCFGVQGAAQRGRQSLEMGFFSKAFLFTEKGQVSMS